MKRNRSRYIVYFEPWEPGKHKIVYSKLAMKKLLRFAEKGSIGHKQRLLHSRDGCVSLWNIDRDYDDWVTGDE